VPLINVNHIEAHIYACRLAAGKDIFPCVGFVISGGHTHLFLCRTPLQFALLGATIDDAAGEAFDKVARILGLGFPGGPAVGGGVAANKPLRAALEKMAAQERLELFVPPLKLCTDNAAMAAMAVEKWRLQQWAPLDLDAVPTYTP